jgi:hypothetical protein
MANPLPPSTNTPTHSSTAPPHPPTFAPDEELWKKTVSIINGVAVVRKELRGTPPRTLPPGTARVIARDAAHTHPAAVAAPARQPSTRTSESATSARACVFAHTITPTASPTATKTLTSSSSVLPAGQHHNSAVLRTGNTANNANLPTSSTTPATTATAPLESAFKYCIVLDFEATCFTKEEQAGHTQEIIEFPASRFFAYVCYGLCSWVTMEERAGCCYGRGLLSFDSLWQLPMFEPIADILFLKIDLATSDAESLPNNQ